MDRVVQVRFAPRELLSVRGLRCVLLVGALVSIVLCLGVFTAKNNEISKNSQNDSCSLFVRFLPHHVANASDCQWVVRSSIPVMVLVSLLLIEALSIVIFVFVFTE